MEHWVHYKRLRGNMSDDFVNRLPIIPDKYAHKGIYPARTINNLGKAINNMRAGDGISIKRNVTSGYTISLEKPFHPFRVYGPTNQGKKAEDYPTVKVYKGTTTRNGMTLLSDCDLGKNYKLLTITNGDGKYIVYLKFNDSLSPTFNPTIDYIDFDTYQNVLTAYDPCNRYIKLATFNISNGNITGIIQNIFQDIDDTVTKLPFIIYDQESSAASVEEKYLNIKIRNGYWFKNDERFGFLDLSNNYQTLKISNIGFAYIYILFKDTYIEVSSATSPLPVDDTSHIFIGEVFICTYGGFRSLLGLNQSFVGDIHVLGGDSLPTPSNEYEVLTAISNAGSLTWESGWVRFHA